MALQLRALATLTGPPGFSPYNQPPVTAVLGHPIPLLASAGMACPWYTEIHADKNAHTHTTYHRYIHTRHRKKP